LEKPRISDREAELRRLKEAMASHEPALLATARFLVRQEPTLEISYSRHSRRRFATSTNCTTNTSFGRG